MTDARGRHRKPKKHSKLIPVGIALAGLAIPVLQAHPADASVSKGGSALTWAEGHATGKPYVYGETGPGGYDCSGLIVAAFKREGISLPRTTFDMINSSRLHAIPVSEARRGDLLFFGTGHVEFDTIWKNTSFGAHHTGTTIGWRGWSSSYRPTMAFRVY